MLLKIAISVIMALSQVQGQTTVTSASGLTYQCSTDPSVIQAFSDEICPTSFTTSSGAVWPFWTGSVEAQYTNAPNSYYSTAASDLALVCGYQDPNAIYNNFQCTYNGGAGSGSGFAAGSLSSGGGSGLDQRCPTIQGDKPQPSPGVNYKKRASPTQFTCPTLQQGGSNYLYAAQFSYGPTSQSYVCSYSANTGNLGCQYDTNGQLIVNQYNSQYVQDCPSQQCQAVQPYTRRRRGLPQPADKRQTSREKIIARQKEISQSFSS